MHTYELEQKIWDAKSKGEQYHMTEEEFVLASVNDLVNFTQEERDEIYTLNERYRNLGEKLDKIGTWGCNASSGIITLSAFGIALTMLYSLINPPKDKEFDMYDKSMAVLASKTKDSKLLEEIEHLRAERQNEVKAAVEKRRSTQDTLFGVVAFGAVIGVIGGTVGLIGGSIADRGISSTKKRANEYLVYNRRFKQKQ